MAHITWNAKGIEWAISPVDSQPCLCWVFPHAPQSVIYDDSRQALYAIF